MKKIVAGLFLCAALGAQAAPLPGRQSEPNPEKLRELRAQRERIADPETEGRLGRQAMDLDAGEHGRVLVLLVEFGGTNTFMWTPGESLWDPFGYVDRGEWNGTNHSDAVASQFFADYYGITGPTNMVYSGPLHNEIPRPPSRDMEDSLWNLIWRPDFSADYYSDIIFGDGAVFDFERDDGSHYYADWMGYSVSNYYAEMSGGKFSLEGDVYGWITLTNSLMYYAADSVPGALSVGAEMRFEVSCFGDVIPEAKGSADLVVDACRAAAELYPEINWADYDLDGDQVVDSLWIVFAGFPEELGQSLDSIYRPETRIWSHSWNFEPVEIADGISVESYIMMPESSGPSVFIHEYGHALGAVDLYTFSGGESSGELWTQMGDPWVGFPDSYAPLAMDPYHLDSWSWLEPLAITDFPEEPTLVELYQAGDGLDVPNGMERAVRIRLENQRVALPIDPPDGMANCWWGGDDNYAHEICSPSNAVFIAGADGMLSLQIAYDVELDYDYVIVDVQTSDDGESWSEWETLANAHTVEGRYGSGLTGQSVAYPEYATETFYLASYVGKWLRFQVAYITDANTQNAGPFLGEMVLDPGAGDPIHSWSADTPADMEMQWAVVDGTRPVPHYYYLQWRNTEADGGYDQVLGYASNEFGRATSGLLVWYVNEVYLDNDVARYVTDFPSYGAKGVAQVVDAHPGVYAEISEVDGRPCTNALVMYENRSLGRDAAFGVRQTFALPGGTNGVQAGRALFTDSRNYGAGAAYTYLDPWSVPPQFEWSAWSYDGSVVSPSRKEYPLRASGMPAETEVHRVWNDGGYYAHASELVSLPGGTGNPLDVGGEYGWNFEVVEDRGTSAVVRIWNSHYCAPYPVLVDCFGEGSTWPADDFLAWPESNAVVQVEAEPYHHIARLLVNGAEISNAVDLQNYSLDLGTVNSNLSVYAFFSADRVAGSTIPQKWFVEQGIPLTEDVLSADFDGDGFSNAAEYAAGTRADDASSGLALSVASTASGVDLSWASQWNHWYVLDYSTNLLDDPFHLIEGPLPGEYDLMEHTLSDSDDESGFYRIRVVPEPE